ncbi:interleukin-12 receptor subunit beta-2 [Tachyglossus aculeatus]|uniref:interleukin-12 receptor subunit beta-2 n=1 Tax=Tachyglossus aculeatus TaxID=9261 RepID=UPI0018F47FF6|nr:interleukin-12 receptor subunit beta-2 [Tachyglossus aculeatus]
MAHAVSINSIAFNLITICLLIQANIDVCKRGDVTVSPARTVVFGSPVTVSCCLKPERGYPTVNKLVLYKNNSRIKSQKNSTISVQVSDLEPGTTLFVCKLLCGGDRKEVRVCGAEVTVGVAPEQPQNISCIQAGEHGNVSCVWSKGRPTHLYTVYTLWLRGPKGLNLQRGFDDQCHGYQDLGFNLSPESPESVYTVAVIAENSLGSLASNTLQFTFVDVVKPWAPTDVEITFHNSSVVSCTVRWKDHGQVWLSHLRYRLVSGISWKQVNVTGGRGSYNLYDLKPFTEYEFQVSSKMHPVRGLWSDWSSLLRRRTPEGEPIGMLDVWFLTQNLGPNTRNISLFWKNLSSSEARGTILRYQVTFQGVPGDEGAGPSTPETFFTQHNSCSRAVPKGDYTVTVSALNAKGRSPPTRIDITHLGCAGSLAPGRLEVKAEGARSVVVLWEHPLKPIDQYVLEWHEDPPKGGGFPRPRWLRLPPSELKAVISESIWPHTCYRVSLYALAGARGGCSSVLGSTGSRVPLSGPQVSGTTTQGKVVWVTWSAVPAHQQMGCILRYRLYVHQRGSTSAPLVFEIPAEASQNSHPLENLTPGVAYVVWLTASTEAGEGPAGHEELLVLEADRSSLVGLTVSIAVLAVGIFSVKQIRHKTASLVALLKPRWLSSRVPDPANSTWAKTYSFLEDEMQLHSDKLPFTWPSSEEPETLTIKEVLHRGGSAPHGPTRKAFPAQEPTQEAGDRAASPTPPRCPQVDPYKTMGPGGPEPTGTQSAPASSLLAMTVDYLPTAMDYLSSAILPSDSRPSDPVKMEDLFPSVFLKIPFQPVAFPGPGNLTLDQVRINGEPQLRGGLLSSTPAAEQPEPGGPVCSS